MPLHLFLSSATRPMALLLAAAGALLSTLAVSTADAAATCQMAGGPWVPQSGAKRTEISGKLISATSTGADTFNMSVCWRHGPCGQGEIGRIVGNKITMQVRNNNVTAHTCEGTFSASCENISWATVPSPDPEVKPQPGCLGTQSWCRAWTPGCESPEPPYGMGFAFLSSLGSNMVLQQAPAKSAVYGIAVGKPTAVKVTVTDVVKKTSYTVDAVVGENATKQPFGPEYAGGESGKGGYATAGPYIGMAPLGLLRMSSRRSPTAERQDHGVNGETSPAMGQREV